MLDRSASGSGGGRRRGRDYPSWEGCGAAHSEPTTYRYRAGAGGAATNAESRSGAEIGRIPVGGMEDVPRRGPALSLVLDSSVTLAWLYAEEMTTEVRLVFDRLVRSGAWVPALWRLKIANSLQMAVRRGRVGAAFRDESLVDLESLPIRIDGETDRQAWGATLQVADANRLTVYDAAYLELAIRRNLPIASLDRELIAAAKASGVRMLCGGSSNAANEV